MDGNDYYLNKMIEYLDKYSESSIAHWFDKELFTWRWWFCVAFIIGPLFIWWKIVDRKRLLEIIVFGLLVNVTCSFLDTIGTSYIIWIYPIRIIPHVPLFFPIDYIDVPVAYMLAYQKFPRWKSFLVSITVIALVFSFIGEPFYVWAKMYVMLHWKYIYSFPVYILIAVVCRTATGWFIKKAGVNPES